MAQVKRKRVPVSSSESDSELPHTQSQSKFIVDNVLRNMLRKSSLPGSSSLSQAPTSSLSASYKQASIESNRGLKGKSRAVSSKKEKSVSEALDEKGRRGRPKNMEFLVARIVFLPYGTTEPDNADDSDPRAALESLFPTIRQSRNPNAAELSRLETLSLARTDFRHYFSINRDWDYFCLDAELHVLFPRLFEYLDGQPKVVNKAYNAIQGSGSQYLSPYLLCVKTWNEIAVSGIDFPTGEDIYEKVKAGKRPSHDECELIFVTRNEIPRKVLESWRHGWADSDSELEETPSLHRLKCRCLGGEDTVPVASTSGATIDLTEDTASDIASTISRPPSADPVQPLPETPPASPPQIATPGSFIIDESISNPWKSGRTFQF
ncbi:hypothetical protein BV22DRAFT_1135234 [Leucogyrophana mollusca]|uniref:Uncharacterized protein n=1 Tax=Leucogyrophana mollusca TaxID=85980 RepID=A0ACB8AWT8_9AGAM|nr:hypothetical protein BV22DRAFT_1135234 [Leucogyrophana mollusca]